jgi:hypothetical protein
MNDEAEYTLTGRCSFLHFKELLPKVFYNFYGAEASALSRNMHPCVAGFGVG